MDQNKSFEVAIGRDNNMVSSLKFYGRSSETTVFETYTPHILHCNEYRSGKTHMTHNDATNFMLIICDFQGVLGPMDF